MTAEEGATHWCGAVRRLRSKTDMITISLCPSSVVSQSFPLSHSKPKHHPDTFPFSALSPYPARASGCPRNALRIQFPAFGLPPLVWPFLEVPSFQFSSVAQSCPALCNPMDCSTPGFPVHHQLLELAQTHVHRVGDAIQTPHPLLSPSPPVFSLSQHQRLFHGVSSSHQVAKVLEFQL